MLQPSGYVIIKKKGATAMTFIDTLYHQIEDAVIHITKQAIMQNPFLNIDFKKLLLDIIEVYSMTKDLKTYLGLHNMDYFV